MPTSTLGSLAEVFAGKPATRLKPGPHEAALLSMRNIADGLYTSGETDRVDVSLKDVARLMVKAGDLIASVRGSFRVAVVSEEHRGAIAGANTAVIRLRSTVPSVTVAAYLRHPEITDHLQRAFVGSTVPGISLDDLRATPIELPTPDRLRMLARLVEAGETYYAAAHEAAEKRRQVMLEVVRASLSREDHA